MSRPPSSTDNDDTDFLLAAAAASASSCLGGSLMKDLLADLAVDEDDDWLSLEQLELELQQAMLESSGGGSSLLMQQQQQPLSSAAGSVVTQQAAYHHHHHTSGLSSSSSPFAAFHHPSSSSYQNNPASAASTLEAWSTPLAASSLQDFLQADTARKQQQHQDQQTPAPPSNSGNTATASFAAYDVTEQAVLVLPPPPGLGGGTAQQQQQQQVMSHAAAQLVRELQQVVVLVDHGTTTHPAPVPPPKEQEPEEVPQEKDKPQDSLGAAAALASQLTLGLERISEDDGGGEPGDPSQSGGHADVDDKDDDGIRTPPLVVRNSKNNKSRSSAAAALPKPATIATPQNSTTVASTTTTTFRTMSAPTPQPTPITTKALNPNVVAAAASNMTTTNNNRMAEDVPLMGDIRILQKDTTKNALSADQSVTDSNDRNSRTTHTSTTVMGSVPPIMGVPVHAPAWQTPTPPPLPPPTYLQQPQQRVYYANPHPSAAPIPATALKSRYMTARDISYVVHGLLKPILLVETAGTMSTYHLHYWMRHHPIKPPPPPPRKSLMTTTTTTTTTDENDRMTLEMISRSRKAREWSEEHKVLGQTNKSNVARPRALIALSSSTNTMDDDDNANGKQQQQRAALWKSRIYCDQAYQCLLAAVMDAPWQQQQQQQGMFSTPSLVQPNLLKLTKCLGIAVQTIVVPPSDNNNNDMNTGSSNAAQARNHYTVDPSVLQLLLRLPKGKFLLARVLEQALLPPAVVSALLPAALAVLLETVHETESDGPASARADDRVFGAWSLILQSIIDLSTDSILRTMEEIVAVMQKQQEQDPSSMAESSSVLSSTSRMQCAHALLHRGSVMASSNADFAASWAVREGNFMNVLAGLK